MLDTLKSMGKEFYRELAVYRMVLHDTRTPMAPKILLGLAVGYAVLPFDLIRDFIPVLGQLDDLIIVPALVLIALKMIPEAIVTDCRRQIEQSVGREEET